MHVDAGHLTPPSPPLSPCHLAPPSSPLLVNCPPCLSLLILLILSYPLAPQFSPQTTPLPPILHLLASVFQPPWNPLILLNLCFFPKNLSSDPLPSNIRPSWPSSPSKMMGSGGHEVPGLIHLKFKIIIIPELFQGIIGHLLNALSYNHCTGNLSPCPLILPRSHKCRCEFSPKSKKYPWKVIW